ncbi:deoxyribodipyrimidine photo-lyase [Chitinophaga sp. sic0106]|uniref:cryptochrome/photolyase family protein n=1 Tax=Chitinophaga sp. sic0106 TaxID=2854785 RepID=UPI001C4693D5|nr:deoxyribodipyrimidine photo-lyase [Chitinophaga sp. sic0106]MBV7533279.1 DNA photolyase family protein [Chitinophaga sp. sic0106]
MAAPVVNLCWFRRDLRLDDNAALYHALKSDRPVLPVFIFDTNILRDLEDKTDARVTFIHQTLMELQHQLRNYGANMEVFTGTPEAAFRYWTGKYTIGAVYTNHDYEPYARQRDAAIAKQLALEGIGLLTFKDQVILEKNEVLKDNGEPYTIFTPYSKKWQQVLTPFHLKPYPVRRYMSHLFKAAATAIPSLASIGFEKTAIELPSPELNEAIVSHYDQTRDFPALEGTSRMGLHLRFGTVSIRRLMKDALALNATYVNELVWREFYQMILWHFPHVVGHSFKKDYDKIPWRNNEAEFRRWCEGQTGYPIVDAGMRELNATGYMHNRVRMITASFLTKHLLIDWRWGEAYFAAKLLDYDLAANNGGWQWAAGSGCDAAPYFRVFNPTLQTQKFDKELKYIRKWVPEFDSFNYVKPMVSHEMARKRVLEVYAKALK